MGGGAEEEGEGCQASLGSRGGCIRGGRGGEAVKSPCPTSNWHQTHTSRVSQGKAAGGSGRGGGGQGERLRLPARGRLPA